MDYSGLSVHRNPRNEVRRPLIRPRRFSVTKELVEFTNYVVSLTMLFVKQPEGFRDAAASVWYRFARG